MPKTTVSRLFRLLPALVAMIPLVVLPPHAMGNPTGEQVVAGNVTFEGGAGTLDITQIGAAGIVNWQDFGIGAGEIVNIMQDGPNAALLNRVLGANPSELLGQLNANGRVFLINPNGVVVGKDASINVMEFIASTLDVTDEDFLNGGDLSFEGDSSAGVLNLGKITATNGDVVLIAQAVTNAGTIETDQGVAALAAGNDVVFMPQGEQRIFVRKTLDAVSSNIGVENSGLIEAAQAELKAAGGNIYELAINQTGVVRASGYERQAGRVLLTAQGSRVAHTGEISARNIDGSGGEVRVGGGFHGADSALPNAEVTYVGDDAVIDVSATAANADAGSAVVWADGATYFGGFIDGRAGEAGGDGAEVEVSGLRLLDFRGLADVSAPAGETGSLLLDPVSLEIVAIGTESSPITLGDAFTFGKNFATDTSKLLVSTLETQLALGNVILDTTIVGPDKTLIDLSGPAPATPVTYADGSITVSSPVAWTSGNRLTFKSANSIYVNANINAGSGDITFGLGSAYDGISNSFYVVPAASPELVVNAAATVTADSVLINRATITDTSKSSNNGEGAINRILINGPIDVGTLELNYPQDAITQYGGITGEVKIDNAANKIGVLRATTGSAVISGDVNVVDSAGGLTIEGEIQGFVGAKINIATTGNLTLASGAKVTTGMLQTTVQGATSDIYLAARGGAFVNNAGASGVNAAGAGRFLIYSATPNTITKGGLTGAPVYNKSFDSNAPATITQTGDRFLYELAPVLTVTATNQTREYGEANPGLTYTITGVLPVDSAADVYSGTPTVGTALTVTSDASTHTGGITVNQTGLTLSDYNYGFSGVAGNLTITPAPLSVTPVAATRNYGDADPAFTGNFTGFKNSETVTDLSTAPTFTPSSTITSPVGTYNLTASGAASPNYTITNQPGTNLFEINPATLTIAAANTTRTYGAADPSFTATFTGLKNSDTSVNFPGLAFATTDSTVTSNAGTGYVIRPSGATNSNYDITFQDGALTINPAPLTITAGNASIDLNDPLPNPTTYAATFSGLVAGDMGSDYNSSLAFANAASNSATSGSFDIVPSGVTDPNYTITFANGTLSIGKGILTIMAMDVSRIYGGANPSFSVSFSGFVNGEDESVLTSPVTFGAVAATDSPVGTYQIVPSGATAPGYTIAFTNGTLSITRAALTITANDANRLYGAGNPVFGATFNGLVAGDTAADITGLTFATDAVTSSGVGSGYYIRPSGATNSNYDVSFSDGRLTISPAALLVTAADATREYGAIDPTFGATYSGFVAGDDASAITGLTLSTNATVNSSVGAGYAITPAGATNPNYTVSFANGALSITQAALLITADAATRIYGDPNPAFTTSMSGLRAGDSAADFVSLVFATVATNTAVGTYGLTVAGAVDPNYTISYAPGELVVTPRSVVVAAPDIAITYGDAVPTATPTITGLASFDTAAVLGPVVVTDPALIQFSDAGTYAITASGVTNSNYTPTYQPGQITIARRAASITANDSTRLYGDANPFFTATTTGIFAADLSSGRITFNTPAVPSSGVGSYAISPIGFTDSNYVVTMVDGALSVTPAPLTVNVAPGARHYGDSFPLDLSLSGLKGDDTDAVLNRDDLQVSVDRAAPVGVYADATLKNAAAANYDVSVDPFQLTITRRPITITAANITRFFGDDSSVFTIANTDTNLLPDLDSVNDVVSLTSFASTLSVADTYPIRVELLNSNYTLASTSGTLTIEPRPIDIVVNNVSSTYGDAIPTFTFDVLGAPLPTTLDGVVELGTQSSTAINGAGYYLITNTAAGDPRRYTISSFQPGVLTVLPRPITLQVGNARQTFEHGTPPQTLAQLATLAFTVNAFNVAPGEPSDLAGYPVRVFSGTSNSVTVVSSNYSGAYPVPTLADFGGAGYFRPTVELPTEEIQVGYTRPAPGNTISFGFTVPEYFGVVPIDLLRDRGNYVITNVDAGRLETKTSTNFLESLEASTQKHAELLEAIEENNKPLVVRGLIDYRTNVGIFLSDFPDDAMGMISSHLSSTFDEGMGAEDPLLIAIFGAGASESDIDPAAITAWLSDIDSNPAKRQVIGPALATFAMGLQSKDAGSYSQGEKIFVEALNVEIGNERTELAAEMTAKKTEWEGQGGPTAGTQLVDLFGMDVPYKSFVSEYVTEKVEAIVAKTAVAVGGTAVGVAAGIGVGAIASSYGAALFPFAVAAAMHGAAISGGTAAAAGASAAATVAAKAATGPFIVIVLAVEVSIIRGIQIAENAKAQKEFESIVDISTPRPLGDMQLGATDESLASTVDRLVMMNAITNMLGDG